VSADLQFRPLLKWAGGKRQLLGALRPYYPRAFERYIEPFFGSGAVFFDLSASGRIAHRAAWLVDDNPDLIGCYRMLRDRTDEVIAALEALARGHERRGTDFYYEVRDRRFNPLRERRTERRGLRLHIAYTPELAAMLIYLNRTGFNGLFRLNRRGAFNVPAGRYTNPRIIDDGHLRSVAAVFAAPAVSIEHAAFDDALRQAGRGDFVYCDPPYAPVSRTACFAQYTAAGFSMADHSRLSNAVIQAAQRGAHVVLSNSRNAEIEHLYTRPEAKRAGLVLRTVPARRAINSRASLRGPVDELIISNVARPDLSAVRPRMLPARLRQKLRTA
jgi:DNA adenine methylase